MGVVMIDDKNFDSFVKGNEKAVIDCYADWCMPCRMVSPILEELSKEMDGVAFAKLNVDYSQNVAMRYGIMSIPTILLFKNGELADMVVGAMPKAMMKRQVEETLS
ncbi:MAG: thioredoxin [Candidatus Thermoplasmatota archaeon]|nr:thioredoxin [Candidatus Thermoplasmatota archaeon]